MKKAIKMVLVIIVLCIGAGMFAGTAQAGIQSGRWKSNIRWTFDTETGELVISGKGAVAPHYGGCDDGADCPGWDGFISKFRSVRFEGKITRIGENVCDFSNMNSVKMCSSIKSIGVMAFWDTQKLKSVRLPKKLRVIQKAAFEFSGLREVIIPGSVQKIGEEAFGSCEKLKRGTIEEGVTRTGVKSFMFSNLEKLKLPKSMEYIETSAFYGTALKKVTLPENVQEIGDFAFSQVCNENPTLKRVNIKSKKITKWGEDIFGKNVRRDLTIHVPLSKRTEYEIALYIHGLPTYVPVIGEKKWG